MEPTRVQGVFNDIMPDNPDAVYEVTVSDSQGNVQMTKTYRRADVVNGMIGFDFTDLQPGTEYNVRLAVNNGGEVFALETLNVRTTSKYSSHQNLSGLPFIREVSCITITVSSYLNCLYEVLLRH